MVSLAARSLVVVMLTSASLVLSGCALFNDAPRSRDKDGTPGRLLIEPEGAYQMISCTGYRDASESVFAYEYQFSSKLVARSRLCPISPSPGGGWRTSEDISIDANTDTVRLTADLEASSFDIPRTWPVPPTLIVYCWDLTDTEPGDLGIGLYHYGPPHDFAGTFRVAQRFNDNPRFTSRWQASALEAEAIFLSVGDIGRFVSDLRETNEDSGYDLEMVIERNTSEEGRIAFDVSGWERAVTPLLEECGVGF